MKRLTIAGLFCLVLGMVAWAQTVYTPDNLPKVHLQDKTRYVTDPDNILTPEARNHMDQMLYQLEQKNGHPDRSGRGAEHWRGRML